MSPRNANLDEYGLCDDPQSQSSALPEKYQRAPQDRIPGVAMHPTVQVACDQRARVFAWVQRYQFNSQATDRRNKNKVLKWAIRNSRPMRHRADTLPEPSNLKYRIKISTETFLLLDFIYSAYKPDRNGKFKYERFFDAIGRFRFDSKKISRQLDIPLRTLQRVLAKLAASGLIDCVQQPQHDSRGEYAGSETWITARADVYMRLLSEVRNQANADKAAARRGPPTPEDAAQQFQKQGIKSVEIGADRNDKNDICLSIIMEPLSTTSQTPVVAGSNDLENYSGAVAPEARSPNFSSQENQTATSPTISKLKTITPLISGVPESNQPSASTTSSEPSTTILAAMPVSPVAPIKIPETALRVGDQEFQRCTHRIHEAFPDEEITMEHCHQVRSWMLRPSPAHRMTYDYLDAVLCEHESGYQLCDPSGKPYKLTLSRLLKSWPQVLLGHKHEQLKLQDAHALDHFRRMMTTQAEAEFEAQIELEIKCITEEIDRTGCDKGFKPFNIHPRCRMLFGYIAFHVLGLTSRVEGIINDHQESAALRDGMLENPLDALIAHRKHPSLFQHPTFKPWFWNTLKSEVKKQYEALLALKAEAEVWNFEEKIKYPALSDPN